ncbi:non-hydrolyzing UDP-N-acetylglucosamine 2-epimerase [Gabonia massiliensis]|uniref:non-hydrolyzing UDP-N-acetylglucosamine 2-epimerase n=1 Tax=Gabonia massiliensis TaxID=1686296 RepID=UPI0006D82EF8|nr:UDP-N-acetylglucosamine 2-epimerase (non-hydrolyzing) [Gabonia massiliensis]
MKKILIAFGTRPEAIKMAPLYNSFRLEKELFETKLCITSQHKEMLTQVLSFFQIKPDYDLDVMQPNQNLFSLTANILNKIKNVFEDFKPDYVFVHGDTTTSMAVALGAFYAGIKICHIEAGLRTYNKLSPFPEEINRQLTGRIADFHFAPTEQAKQNLLSEHINSNNIIVTGNTVIDALLESKKILNNVYTNSEIQFLDSLLTPNKKIILVTGHRRENQGDGFIHICEALKKIANLPDVEIVYPVHLNPNVKDIVYQKLNNIENIHLISPLSYPAFIWLMQKSYIILTDSGGIQEEAPSLGKPVLVMRNTTERPEAVKAGTVIMVGTDTHKIFSTAQSLLYNSSSYSQMSTAINPYGDGFACKRIISFMKNLDHYEKDNQVSSIL